MVVPVGGGQSPVGKGPDFCQVSGVGRHRGMAGPPGPIILMANLGLSCAPAGARGQDARLRRKLWTAAKQSEGRRFHPRVHRGEVCGRRGGGLIVVLMG